MTSNRSEGPGTGQDDNEQIKGELIGVALVFAASAGICSALNIQKYVHIRNFDPASGQTKVNFMKIPLWWIGMLLNTASESVWRHSLYPPKILSSSPPMFSPHLLGSECH